MKMISTVILGNIFSLGAAICLTVSVIKKTKTDFIGWQIGDDIFGCLTCLTLGSYSALTVCLVCFIRNLLAYKNKLNRLLTGILFLTNIIVGLYVNNLGAIGWLPVIAAASYTIFVYLAKTAQHMRIALISNLSLWVIHCLYIQAYPSAFVNLSICLWTIYQALKRSKWIKKNAIKLMAQ